ncbi:MAG: T9SS type A sorting domain-containing protein [Flavobacteriales bacterium]
MKSRLVILVLTVFSSFNVFSQLEQIYVETIYHDGIEIPALAGYTTYRIYAELDDPQFRITSMTGTESCPLEVTTCTEFFRGNFHSNALLGSIINPEFLVLPEEQFSSGLTIGVLNSDEASASNEVIVIINPDDPWDTSLIDGENLIIGTGSNGGGIAVLGTEGGYGSGVNNSVLLGQFTTTGDLSFKLNLTIAYSDNNDPYLYSWCNSDHPALVYNSSSSSSSIEVCQGEMIQFNATENNAESYSWDIAGQSLGMDSTVFYEFSESGEYVVQLETQTGLCTNTHANLVTVNQLPSSEFMSSTNEICAGDMVEFIALESNLETYSWTLNGDTIGTNSAVLHEFTEVGELTLELAVQNQQCSSSESLSINVNSTPEVQVFQNSNILTSSKGDAYQWFLNGEVLDGATNQEYSVTEDGTYTVEVTNGGLCTGTSEGVLVVNISEPEAETILLYPNPMTDRAFLEFEDASTRTVRLLDSNGKEVRVWESVAMARIEITKGELAAGNYVVSLEADGSVQNLQLIVK